MVIQKDSTQMGLLLPASESGGENSSLPAKVTAAALVPTIDKPTEALREVPVEIHLGLR